MAAHSPTYGYTYEHNRKTGAYLWQILAFINYHILENAIGSTFLHSLNYWERLVVNPDIKI